MNTPNTAHSEGSSSHPQAARLEFRNVSKTYPGSAEPAIQDLSFEVPARDAGRLGAAILVAALAIAAEVGLSALQRKLTPEGLRLTEQAASRRRLLSIPKRRIAPTP